MSSRQSGATRDLSHKVDFSPFGRRPWFEMTNSRIKPLWVNIYITTKLIVKLNVMRYTTQFEYKTIVLLA